jgi:hypothetical protein
VKKYFSSTIVMVAVIGLFVQACGVNKPTSPRGNVAAADAAKTGGDKPGANPAAASTCPAPVAEESQAMKPLSVDTKLTLNINCEKVEVSVDGTPALSEPTKGQNESKQDTSTLTATANILINTKKLEIKNEHTFVAETELGAKAKEAIRDRMKKQQLEQKAIADEAAAKTKKDDADKKASENKSKENEDAAKVAGDEATKATEARTAAGEAVKSAIEAEKKAVADREADAKSKEASEANRKAQTILNKDAKVDGLTDYKVETAGALYDETSKVYTLYVRLTRLNKQDANLSRTIGIVFGKMTTDDGKTTQPITSLVLESPNDPAKSLEEGMKIIIPILSSVKPDAAKPDAAKPDAAKPDAAKPDAAKPDAAKPDAAKPATELEKAKAELEAAKKGLEANKKPAADAKDAATKAVAADKAKSTSDTKKEVDRTKRMAETAAQALKNAEKVVKDAEAKVKAAEAAAAKAKSAK